MAGMDLPQGSYFFDYQAFHPHGPQINPAPVLEDREPDTRNTLLWSTGLLLEENKQAEISFRAPKAPGRYVVLVRALRPDGKPIAASALFSVR
jgi:hypothetical protein